MTDNTLNNSPQKEFSFYAKQKTIRKPKARLSTITVLNIDLYMPRWLKVHSFRHLKITKATSLYLARFKSVKSYSFDRTSFIEEQRKEVQKRHINLGKKGFHEFITHIIKHLKSVESTGQPLAQIDVAKSLEHFRQHYTAVQMKPYEHMRNIAYWLQQLCATQTSRNPHIAIAEAVIKGLRNAGYKYTKLETRYRTQTIVTPVFTDEALSRDLHAFLKERDTHKQSVSIPRAIVRIGFTQSALIQYP
ncbi:MAG: hypothetical protein VX185_09305 [Pseudomonadota bacterium]|nr:hypothetical protein [Gammaproteobacteria bacterium]MEC8010949.1 hypothetical protein [Pseudomonadota bacterium]HBF09695.1 hypothetical protein [Gammaproteobacteria bacterium]|tara:strand:+ start:7223 stop:7963 length:741 start_codon:yes stop_codon:yes gene_type:complete